MDSKISVQKKSIEQKKARLLQAENILKLKERKARIKHLIEIGGLLSQAQIDHLPANILFGALVELKQRLTTDPSIIETWNKIGSETFNDTSQSKIPIILQFTQKLNTEIKNIMKKFGLKWNPLRNEWYGYVQNIDNLKNQIQHTEYVLTQVEISN